MSIAVAIREPYMRALGLISAAHFMSHFYGMILPPLFPFLNAELGLSYTVLGVLLAAKKTTSGLCQLPAGVAVDRIGARTMLLFGLLSCSICIGLLGFISSPILFGILVIAFGAANSVFHPTDYSILNSSMPEQHMAKSFSVHTFCGHLGTAVAPVVILTLTALWNWRIAAISVGIVGLIICLMIISQLDVLKDGGSIKRRKKKKDGAAEEADAAEPTKPMTVREVAAYVIRTPALLYLFMFFAITSLAGGGLRDFAVAGLVAAQGTPVAAAGSALTGFFFASAIGVLAGGWVAGQTKRHDMIAAIAFAIAGIMMAIIGLVDLHYTLIVFCFTVAGFVNGMVRPARDMMVRAASPKGGMGQVFGFVFSGQTVGGAIAPVAYGMMLDFGNPAWVFYTSAFFMFLCMLVIIVSGHAARKQEQQRMATQPAE